MRFAFNLFNHTEAGQRTLHDVIMILSHQLSALGRSAAWSNGQALVGPGTMNVLVEGFSPESVEIIARARAKGARFLIIATEQPTPAGFNHGIEKSMVDRQAIFPEAARLADAILALVPGTEGWYSQFAPAARLELGYAPTLVRHVTTEPDHEFGFFGSLTPRRHKILKQIGRRTKALNAVRVVANFADQSHRDQEMGRAKVILQIRAHEKMGLVSSSRCNTALHLGRPVVAEPHLLSHPWDEVVHFSATPGAFLDDAIAMRWPWRRIHQAQFDNFRALFSPERCIGAALEQVGLVQARRAA